MRYLIAIVGMCLITGCMSMGKKIDQTQLTQFKKGQTTYDEVVQKLGQPTQSTLNSDGSRMVMYM